ncbi:cytochrome b/b6 domain-containing protein [Desulfovibrio sp. OttesenSCG-928-F20]|nr:cytochrome b/b6 domain-containing protein [Desulfovibrio sp. OttesenSCG-928-M16]MDL2291093.1 cytochrome b/b6 domain-containing protein [Desulfovibrio sp. OttesenSCG-928-F20]
MARMYLYTRFERFWHWVQALLVLLMLLTGFEIHGTYSLLGFERAVVLHNGTAFTWGGLYAFILFWLAITGEWRQYLPRLKKVGLVIRYYAIGIFKGEAHPVHKSPESKHNPLQRLAYLSILSFLLPFQIVSGLLYYLYNHWPELGINSLLSLEFVAVAHTLGAFSLLAFVIGHVYMTTTGPKPYTYLAGMITGYEEEPKESLLKKRGLPLGQNE